MIVDKVQDSFITCMCLQSSTATIAEAVDLLLELKEPPTELCKQFLEKYVL